MSLKAWLSSTVDNGSGSGGVSRISPLRLAVVVVVESFRKFVNSQLSHKKVYHFLTCDDCETMLKNSPCEACPSDFTKNSQRKQ